MFRSIILHFFPILNIHCTFVIQSSGLIVDMVALVEGNFGGIIDICIYMNQLLKALKNSPF